MINLDVLFSPAAPADLPSVDPEPSILAEYVFFPFYDKLVLYFPKSWMPNKVTLVGVFATLLSSALLLSAMPPGTHFVPDYVLFFPATLVVDDPSILKESPLFWTQAKPYFSNILSSTGLLTLCGFLNLVYCVADNTDGRLARRDRKTSVIGEYLDHGLDCVTSLLSAAITFAVCGVSLSNMSISISFLAFVTVLSHTLHYERNIFIWGNRIATVDEAMVFFAVCMWVPLIVPSVTTATVPVGLLRMFCSESCALWLARLKGVDLLYIFYNLMQLQTIFGILWRYARMLFRVQVLSMIMNGVVLLGCLPMHNAHVVAALPETSVTGYTVGPFTYPAIWIITCACTSSIIVHISICARCARLQRVDPLPLAGVVIVWMLFLSLPAVAAALAVVLHAAQVIYNVHFIERYSPKARAARMAKDKRM